MKKLGFKGLKWIGLIAGVFGSLILVLTTLLFIYPSALINNYSLEKTVVLLKRFGISITYQNAEVATHSESLTDKTFNFSFEKLAIVSEGLDTNFRQADFTLGFNLLGQPNFINQVGPVKIVQGVIEIEETTSDETDGSDFNPNQLYRRLLSVNFKPIQIEELRFDLVDSKGKLTSAQFDLGTAQNTDESISVNMRLRGLKGFQVSSAELNGTFFEIHKQGIPLGELTFSGTMSDGKHLHLDLSTESKNKKINLLAVLNFAHEKTSVESRIVAEASPDKVILGINATTKNLSSAGRRLNLSHCQLHAAALGGSWRRFRSELTDCKISAVRRTLNTEKNFPVVIPRKFSGEVVGKADISLIKPYFVESGDFTLKLDPIQDRHFQISGGLGLEVKSKEGSQRRPDLILKADAEVSIERFENLVADLERSRFAVPAPFHTLSGSVSCNLKGKVDYSKQIIKIPHSCRTDLKSADQALVIKESGKVKAKVTDKGVSPHLSADVALDNVNLYLPELGLRDPVPPLTSDGRFVRSPQLQKKDRRSKSKGGDKNQNKAANFFSYDIRVNTNEKTVRIHAPNFNATLPINTNLVFSSGKSPTGELSIKTFKVSVLNKNIDINHIHLLFREFGAAEIDAQAVIKKTDYDIIVEVLGTTQNPQLEVSSDPPRPDSELMSSMMYGGSYSQLSNDEKSSVAETRAAMTDGAISLASMFYLASTPVESVGYNPHSKQLSAQFKIREGTSLKVGGGSGSSRVGVAKRLVGNWTFETFAVSEEESDQTRGIAMLRWTNRY